ncbi:MAG: branched-chain amino acid aminotransferase [Gammaproteobacteria bacterium]|nr:branched-chain amino acid aminotransferase [Gammaproteobacteria bacterium]
MVRAVGYIDGEIDVLENIKVPVLDRGFLYGDSIYEVFRTYDGIPFMYDEHYQRLLNSASLIGMKVTHGPKQISDAVIETLAKSEVCAGDDVYVRYQITRGSGPIDLNPDLSEGNRLIIIIKAVPKWNPDHYTTGMSLAVPVLRRNSVTSLDPNIKGGNYLNNILALAQAREVGADDCVMLDSHRKVTECSNSNVWFVIDGKIVTPERGNLVGLTRKTLIDLLTANSVIAEEREIDYDELKNASECFVTSATREVMPVCSLILEDGSKCSFASGGGPKTRHAMQLYQQMLVNFKRDNADQALF